MRIPALTLHRPWPVLMFFAGKDVENRSWSTRHRGPLLIHAGKAWAESAVRFAAGIETAAGTPASDWISMDRNNHPTGIVGVVDLVAVLEECTLPWAMQGQQHWFVRNRRAFSRAIPCAGRQQLWYPPDDIQVQVDAALAEIGVSCV